MFPQRNIAGSVPVYGGMKSRLPGIAVTIGLHAAVVLALLSYAPARQTLAELAPIMVSLVQPKPAEPPKELPKPRPVVKQPVKRIEPKPLPLLTATAPEVPAPAAIQPPPPAPQPPPEPVAAEAAPAPVIPPQFNAGYLNNPAPVYPAVSRRLGEEGRVVLRVFVDERGLPARVELRTSSGHERLDGIAMQTVRQWKFVPARRGDQAVSAWVLVPISFSLRS
ncbi:MAG: TonB family protein [Burkholderiales bacterium]|nr:TonB family protein [Burkholderiales bacterium]